MARHFPNWLKAYMSYTRDTESPDEVHFWTAVATIAGALRRHVWIEMRKFQWTPNFYIILVGPPGIITKSTSIRTGMRLLKRIDGVDFGPQSMTWQALTESMQKAAKYFKYIDDDGIEQNMVSSALTIELRELGTFFKMEDQTMVDVMVDLWDGQLENWGHKTKTQGNIDVPNPWINILGATTPSWLEQNFPKHMIGGGLASRIIFVYGDKKRQYVPYPDEVIHSKEYYELETKLTEDLKDIATICGKYKLEDNARAWGHEFYEKLWKDRPVHMASDRFSGYMSRKMGHVHKLAIVLAAAQRNDLVIQKDDLEYADKLLTLTEGHMIKVFESIGVVDSARHVTEIVAYVKAYGWITSNDLFSLLRNTIPEKEFKDALRIAVQGGVLAAEQRDQKWGVTLVQRTIN